MEMMRCLIVLILLLQYHTTGASEIDPVATNSAMFTLGNLQAAAIKIQGASTTGGNSSLIGANTNDYYSQGNLIMMSTNILGNITLGGSLSNSASRFGSLTLISTPLHDFRSLKGSLIETSNYFGQMTPNGSAAFNSNDDIILTGTDFNLNVFQISNPNYYTFIQIDVPPTSTTIINIMGENPYLLQNVFNSFNNPEQNADPAMVLYNFPQAKSVTLNNNTIAGTLLAPRATTSISSFRITGGVITNNLTIKGTSIVGDHYKGYFDPPIRTPEPRTIILAGISILTCILIQTRHLY